MPISKQNIYSSIDNLYQEIAKAPRKEKEYILYTDLQKLKEIEAILRFRNPEQIEEEIHFHRQTQQDIMREFSIDQMSSLFEAMKFKPKVTELFHKEQRQIHDLERQLSIHKNYQLGEIE